MASKKDFINLHSDAFDTVFGGNLVHCLKISHFSKNCSINFFYKFDNPEINRQQIFPASFKNSENREDFYFPPRFCVYKRASSLFTGIVFKSHIHVHIQQKDRICIKKGPRLNLRDMLTTGKEISDTLYNIRATLCESFCDVITR